MSISKNEGLDPQSLQTNSNTVRPAAIRTSPRPVHSDVILRFQSKYADYRLPEDVACATIRCMIAIAQQQTHCPIVLSRVTGCPLRFTAAVIWCLLRNPDWLDELGYPDLIELIAAGSDRYEEIENSLWCLYERVLFDPCSATLDLRYEWAECNGIPPEG